MKKTPISISCFPFLLLLILYVSPSSSSTPFQPSDRLQTFIIHVSPSHKPSAFSSHKQWYSSLLRSLPSPHPTKKLLYTYSTALHGFSARLTASQAAALRRLPSVLSVLPDRIRHVHTTRTPHFLGLADSSGLWPNSDYADDVIIGVLDTGIWPDRRSFSDEGLSPVPSGWKGKCESAPDFPATSCNRKIIGARAFFQGYDAAIENLIHDAASNFTSRIKRDLAHTLDVLIKKRNLDQVERRVDRAFELLKNLKDDPKSPLDTEGHGTHTASTAAGSVVPNASLYDYARGEARGMAIKARIAVYKICWSLGCFDSDILAAMDQSVADGVHVISLSVGASGKAPPYDRDSIAIGAFGAARHGVLVSCSAGNSGPGPFTAVNIAPWILTVGASTIDREFPADLILGDGRVFGGVSLYSGDQLGDSKLPLVNAADCGDRYCYSGKLESAKVAGKIVICDRGGNARVAKGGAVKVAGGAGMIIANTADSGEELVADSHLIAATMVGQIAGNKIKDYVKSDPSPTATIVFKGTVYGTSPPAPRVAAFSSRGPNHLTAEILKPDVIAPGVNILAGWTGYTSPTDLDIDPRRVDFNIISGTSMSCPHVSGLAALLRKAYPEWTPAAIKSALMTTSYNLDNTGRNFTDLATGGVSTPFIHGAGHVDPNRALNPGLVYDIHDTDYMAFLCAIGYDAKRIAIFAKDHPVDCSAMGLASPGGLNYPSFSVTFDSSKSVVKYKRTVKNVGNELDAVYRVKVSAPVAVEINVSPNKLVFSEGIQTLSYEITFTSDQSIFVTSVVALDEFGVASQGFGSIEWTDGTHSVRSPIAVVWQQGPSAASM